MEASAVFKERIMEKYWVYSVSTYFFKGGSILCDKDPKISGKKRKRSSILSKVDFYEVCALLFKVLYYCYYFYTNTSFPSARFVASLTQ